MFIDYETSLKLNFFLVNSIIYGMLMSNTVSTTDAIFSLLISTPDVSFHEIIVIAPKGVP